MMKDMFKLYDAFEDEKGAKDAAEDLRKGNSNARVRRLNPTQDGGRLKWGVFTDDKRLV